MGARIVVMVAPVRVIAVLVWVHVQAVVVMDVKEIVSLHAVQVAMEAAEVDVLETVILPVQVVEKVAVTVALRAVVAVVALVVKIALRQDKNLLAPIIVKMVVLIIAIVVVQIIALALVI